MYRQRFGLTGHPLPKDATVLVVEDNLVNQRLITVILEKFGCRVILANNGLEEGSYGRSSYGFERPEDAAGAACPMPQNLQYTCE